MKLYRFFIDSSFIHESSITLPDDVAQHAIKVLRLKGGDQLIVIDDSKNEYLIQLDGTKTSQVKGKIIKQSQNTNEPNIEINLFQSLLPREKFEQSLQKGVEAGVSTFVPLLSDHAIFSAEYASDQKLNRWHSVIKEAAQQSERGTIPLILKAQKFEQAITTAAGIGPFLIAHPYNATSCVSALKNLSSQFLQDDTSGQKKKISLFIGPEGGFSQKEIDFAKNKGAIITTLGRRIFRSETAGPILSFLVLFSLNEL